jgi:hypothetical protein
MVMAIPVIMEDILTVMAVMEVTTGAKLTDQNLPLTDWFFHP